MSTFGTLVAEIRGDLHRGSDFDERIKTAICAAIRHYRTERLAFNTTQLSMTVSSSVEYQLLPSNFIEMDTAVVDRTPLHRRVMIERTMEAMDDRFDSAPAQFGQPDEFCIRNRQLRLFPIPDGGYVLILNYHCDLMEVSQSASTAATNAWMTEGYDLIKLHALADLHVNYIRADESSKKAMEASTLEAEIFRNLKRRANREQSTGRTRPYCV